jgi:mannose-6-phosphate isomerase-like protein (cupin superfamily)
MSESTSRNNAEHYNWGEGCDGWHLLRSETVSIIEEIMPPGTSEVPHYHRSSQQFFYVLAGTLSVATPSAAHLLNPSEGIKIARGVRHRVANVCIEPVRFLVVSAPPSHGDRMVVQSIQPVGPVPTQKARI